jgi:hypothetical protein
MLTFRQYQEEISSYYKDSLILETDLTYKPDSNLPELLPNTRRCFTIPMTNQEELRIGREG